MDFDWLQSRDWWDEFLFRILGERIALSSPTETQLERGCWEIVDR